MTRFGRYQLVRLVGKGGMAEIWKARIEGPKGFEKTIALKRVLPELGDDADFVAMLIEEAKLVASLAHPNIVQVLDFGAIEGRYFVALEYVAGANVAALVQRLAREGRTLPREVALYVGLGAARALGYAHAKTDAAGTPLRIVHRDVSPQNVLVSFDGDAKLGDFGIARAANAISRTEHGRVRGKIAWMSPEQARSEPLDGRSDLFALGLVLYEMLLGRRLLAGATEEIYRRVTEFTEPGSAELAPLAPPEKHVLRLALAGDPEARFRDGSAMEDAIAIALNAYGGEKPARAKLGALVRECFTAELARERDEATGSGKIEGKIEGKTAAGSSAGEGTAAPTLATPADANPSPGGAPVSRGRRALLAGAGATAVAAAAGAAWRFSGARGRGLRRGGVLRMAMTLPDEPFTPFTTADTRSRAVLGMICEPILSANPDEKHPSGVVGAARMRDDGRRVELTLRPGVFFHDHPCFADGKGRAATAEDLAFSIALAIRDGDLGLPIAGAAALRAKPRPGARPSGLSVVSTDTLAIEFDSPSSFYEVELSGVLFFPKELETNEPDFHALRQPVGTGPWRFSAPPRLDTMVLERAPRYWQKGEDGRPLPYLDRVEIVSGGDYLGLINAIRHGEIDVATPRASEIPKFAVFGGARPRLVPELDDPGLELGIALSENGYRLYGLFCMRRPGPLADVRVRKAIALALDRAAIAKASHFDAPATRFLRDDQVGYDPTIADLRYDPAAAQKLLAAAGHPGAAGFDELVIAKFGHPPADDLAVDALRALGFKVRIVSVTGASFETLVREKAADGVLSMYSYAVFGTEVPGMAAMYRGWGSSDASADAFATKLAATPVRADRVPLYGQIERAFLDELPMIPIGWGARGEPVAALLVRRGVEGLVDPATGRTSGTATTAWLSSDRRAV